MVTLGHIKTRRCSSASHILTVFVQIYAMATRRLLSKAFGGRYLFRNFQNAQCWKPVEFQRFGPWFLQRRGLVIPAYSHVRPAVIHGDHWREELKNLNRTARASPPPDVVRPPESKISAGEERRLLRLVQMDDLRKTLRQIPHASISLKELLQICMNSTGEEDAKKVVKSLDESGQVLIVGDCVYLRPEQVAMIVENMLPLLNAPRRQELEEMEKQKAEIDVEAEKIVRRELWGGLGLMILQTAYLMRLTFWELSWDVMEPVCFFLTSAYFLVGYAFFLRTSTDPTFEGFFQARLKTKQKTLMKNRNFDIERFKELRMITGRSLRQPCRDLFPAI